MRCSTMDGEITSTVDGTEIPTEDNQSNFGSGFGYQYGQIPINEIYMNEMKSGSSLNTEKNLNEKNKR